MATQCVASTRLALSNMLCSVLRSEFISAVRQSPPRQPTRQFFKPQHARLFSVTNRLARIEINESHDLITIPQSSGSLAKASQQTKQPFKFTSSPHETASSIDQARKGNGNGKSRGSSDETNDNKDTSRGKVKHQVKDMNMRKKKKTEAWRVQKAALEKKFPSGWNPPKKLSPDAMDGIRHLNATAPSRFTTAVLAQEFKVSPEAIRRILKSKWKPSTIESEDRRERWEKRHELIWSRKAELGLRPSTKTSRPLSDANILYKPGEEEGV
ncbi:Required for respiratory growth protein 9 [Penicillium macrosclerotiorum]|uniref:Required for respiratory growth protein 9 n=1 Tax=Penicillium macrosclerotiorum TaxID=303699 RepID=UPI002548AA6A|nr:Required for respiratory growth protein 9 [Penicillium macrosclerotiorum]KAJ5666696.1 Required for respiratory growth protein 9 [Penicillium macrosclerotiorum]